MAYKSGEGCGSDTRIPLCFLEHIPWCAECAGRMSGKVRRYIMILTGCGQSGRADLVHIINSKTLDFAGKLLYDEKA